jgi:cathepsin L
VLVVGYDTDGGYWNVKNSWGPGYSVVQIKLKSITGWGMEGYIWMSKDEDNNCGIATYATLPRV